jgi:LacI family transcriptional regulator
MTGSAGASRRRPTMEDVAQRSGVSLKSVSRVINEELGASLETRNRVRIAVQELGYHRNHTAHVLRRRDRRSACIGVILDDVGNPFAATLNRAAEEVARAHENLVLAASTNSDPDSEQQLVHRLLARGVDGLVIMSARTDHTYLSGELERGVPIVFVDRPARGIRATSVVAANRAASRLAVEHLIAHGHRRIAFLSDWAALYTTAQRHRGYLDAHRAQGSPVRRDLQRSGLIDTASAQRALITLIKGKNPPTAIFAANNLTCIRVLHALHWSGLTGTVALIGFDDIECAELLNPPVSVLRQDPDAMGRLAAETIFAQLAGQQPARQELQIPVTLVPRGSGELAAPGTPIRKAPRNTDHLPDPDTPTYRVTQP